MPINCNQPNVYQYGESWTTDANEYHTTSLITKYQETTVAAPADSHGGDHTAQFVAASQGGGGQLPVHCCLLQLWGTRYYIGLFVSSRNELNLKYVVLTFCKTYKSPFYCHKYHQTKWRVHTPYPIITVQK